jgi:hypothetical protein
MAEVFRGLYRTIAWAYVTNRTMAFQVPEADYSKDSAALSASSSYAAGDLDAVSARSDMNHITMTYLRKRTMTQLKVTKNTSSIEHGREGQDQVQDRGY